jgi:hypothetical protein
MATTYDFKKITNTFPATTAWSNDRTYIFFGGATGIGYWGDNIGSLTGAFATRLIPRFSGLLYD